MTLFGNVNGQTVGLASDATTPAPDDPGISRTGGIITATTLTGAAGTARRARARRTLERRHGADADGDAV